MSRSSSCWTSNAFVYCSFITVNSILVLWPSRTQGSRDRPIQICSRFSNIWWSWSDTRFGNFSRSWSGPVPGFEIFIGPSPVRFKDYNQMVSVLGSLVELLFKEMWSCCRQRKAASKSKNRKWMVQSVFKKTNICIGWRTYAGWQL